MAKYQGKHSAAPGTRTKERAVSSSKPDASPGRREASVRPSPPRPVTEKPKPPRPEPAHETPSRTERRHETQPRTETMPKAESKREPKPRTGNRHIAAPAERVPQSKHGSGPKSSGPRGKKKSKWFRVFLLLYALVLLTGSGYLQHRLWTYLETSQAETDREEAEQAAQAAQAAHEKAVFQAPQLVFEDWEKGLTTDYWTDLWYEQSPNDLDIRERVYAYMAERFAPDALQAYRDAGSTQETPVYILKNGEAPLARVTLSGSELEWTVSEVELLFDGTYSASVTVPGGCTVCCNDQQLGKEYRQTADSLMTYKLLDEQLENAVTWYCYSVDGLLTEPELTVEPPEGQDLLPYGDDGYLLLRSGDNSAYTDRSIEFVKTDLAYYMNGARGTWSNLNRVLQFLRKGTQAYEDTKLSYNGICYSNHYNNIDTSKTYAGDVIVWADNCFSVDVTYDADCERLGEPVDFANATMRLYFLLDGEEYYISNFETL